MEQLAPHEKVFVDREMLEDENHGDLTCVECHGGDPESRDFAQAHREVDKDPSYPAPGICSECHEAEAEHYRTSLHHTLKPMKNRILARGNPDPAVQAKLETAFNNHCGSCHSSCGQCHISRPASVEGGLLSGHLILKRAPVKETCTACHGSRVGAEYFGQGQGCQPDVHRQKKFMKCQKCHPAVEMHGDGKDHADRYGVENGPACLDCHQDIYGPKGENRTAHEQHRNKVACQVCHSQPYNNCFGCHLRLTGEGRPYYELKAHRVDFKIGLNPNPGPRRPERFVTVRHVPIAPDSFREYAGGALTRFDRFPTWRTATAHNIRRTTEQNSDCNNCHGNKRLFLRASDVEPETRRANEPVVVPLELIPARIQNPGSVPKETRKK